MMRDSTAQNGVRKKSASLPAEPTAFAASGSARFMTSASVSTKPGCAVGSSAPQVSESPAARTLIRR